MASAYRKTLGLIVALLCLVISGFGYADQIKLYEGFYYLQPKAEVLAAGAQLVGDRVTQTIGNPGRSLSFQFSPDDRLIAVSIVRDDPAFDIHKAMSELQGEKRQYYELIMLSIADDQMPPYDMWWAWRRRDTRSLVQMVQILKKGDLFVLYVNMADVQAAFPNLPENADEMGKGMRETTRLTFLKTKADKVLQVYTVHGQMDEAMRLAREQ